MIQTALIFLLVMDEPELLDFYIKIVATCHNYFESGWLSPTPFLCKIFHVHFNMQNSFSYKHCFSVPKCFEYLLHLFPSAFL